MVRNIPQPASSTHWAIRVFAGQGHSHGDEDSVVLAHERCGVLVMLILRRFAAFAQSGAHAFGLLRPLRPGRSSLRVCDDAVQTRADGSWSRHGADSDQCDGLAIAAVAGPGGLWTLSVTFRYQRPRASSLIEPYPAVLRQAVAVHRPSGLPRRNTWQLRYDRARLEGITQAALAPWTRAI